MANKIQTNNFKIGDIVETAETGGGFPAEVGVICEVRKIYDDEHNDRTLLDVVILEGLNKGKTFSKFHWRFKNHKLSEWDE